MRDLPADVRETATRLTRRAREARTPAIATSHRDRREELLAEYGYVARVREEDSRTVLVLYPSTWIDDDGVVRTDRIEDVERAFEIQLSGVGDPDDWDAVDAHNRAVAERVRDEHGDDHGANAAAFADFMGNHYAKPIEEASPREQREFLSEYYPRNVWPSDAQRSCVETSVDLAIAAGRALAERPSG